MELTAKKIGSLRLPFLTGGLAALALAMPGTAVAEEAPSNAEIAYALDNMILFIAAVLVFFMQAGFALLEAVSTSPRIPSTSS